MKVGDKVRVYRKVKSVPGCITHKVGFKGIITADVTIVRDPVQVFLVWDKKHNKREIVPKTALAYAKD